MGWKGKQKNNRYSYIFMNYVLYLFLIAFPIPLIILIFKYKTYTYVFSAFISFIGIYMFIIVGSIEVINDKDLFSFKYYFSLFIILFLFYIFYIFIFLLGKRLYINLSENITLVKDRFSLTFIVCLWSISILTFIVYFNRHGLPVIFDIDIKDYVDIYALREEKWSFLSEGSHWYKAGFFTIPQIAVIYSYIYKIINKKYRFFFYTNLIIGIFFLIFSATKSPIVELIFCLFITRLLLKEMSIKLLFFYFVLFLMVIFALLSLYYLDKSPSEVFTSLFDYLVMRILVDYTMTHAYVLNIFPDLHDYFYGLTFGNPGNIFPFTSISLSHFINVWVYGVVANCSVPSFSEGYANFGFLGFLIILLIMFFQIIIFQIIFKYLPVNVFVISLYIFFSVNMLNYAISSIENVFPLELILIFSILFFVYYIIQQFKKPHLLK